MLNGEIHSDEIMSLNICASDDKAAIVMKQNFQETQEETAVTLVARDDPACSAHCRPGGKNLESSSHR